MWVQCLRVHDNTHSLLWIFSQMDCCKHTADLIHINEPNLYNENLMPTICDWVPSVYQCAKLGEELVCMSVQIQMGDKLKVSQSGVASALQTSIPLICQPSVFEAHNLSKLHYRVLYKDEKSIHVCVLGMVSGGLIESLIRNVQHCDERSTKSIVWLLSFLSARKGLLCHVDVSAQELFDNHLMHCSFFNAMYDYYFNVNSQGHSFTHRKSQACFHKF